MWSGIFIHFSLFWTGTRVPNLFFSLALLPFCSRILYLREGKSGEEKNTGCVWIVGASGIRAGFAAGSWLGQGRGLVLGRKVVARWQKEKEQERSRLWTEMYLLTGQKTVMVAGVRETTDLSQGFLAATDFFWSFSFIVSWPGSSGCHLSAFPWWRFL